jgi:hypothetical protein
LTPCQNIDETFLETDNEKRKICLRKKRKILLRAAPRAPDLAERTQSAADFPQSRLHSVWLTNWPNLNLTKSEFENWN